MFIQTEETPNPATLKFMPGKVVMEEGVSHFESAEEARVSPLASRLFSLGGVAAVFYGREFISVTKTESKEWYVLKPPVLGAIMEHFVSNTPLFYASKKEDVETQKGQTAEDEYDKDTQAIVNEIKELLETRVRPAVAMDGGDISFERFEDGVVFVSLKGACSGCPSSSATLKSGIENMLKYYVPEVEEVRPIEKE